MARKKGKASRSGSAPKSRSLRDADLEEVVRLFAGEGYPPAEERQKIIERRMELVKELIGSMVSDIEGDETQPGVPDFIGQYGERDTIMAMRFITHGFQHPSVLTELAWIYRSYRRAYARWGDSKPFLSRADYNRLNEEYADALSRREALPIHFGPGKREKELRDLLLLASELWEDVVPPDVPPRPADFQAPPPQSYPAPLDRLLEWGPVPDTRRLNKTVSTDRRRWQAAAPDLRRMVLDEGLLAGWPGEAASWAPEHALAVLRLARPNDDYPALAALSALAARPDDWLSDALIDVWAAAGPGIEPALTAEFSDASLGVDRRFVLLAGLQRLADDDPARRAGILRLLANTLASSPAEHAELNAGIVTVLDQFQATEASGTVRAAFEEGRVDEGIIKPSEIDWI